MKKLSLALCPLFILILSIDLVAQINTPVFREYNNSFSKYESFTSFQSLQPQNQINSFADLLGSKPKKETQGLCSLIKLSLKKNNSSQLNHVLQAPNNNSIMYSNRRLKYSSLWAFASLNYLYADLVGLMDLNLLSQYQTGVVNGVEITPAFLTVAAAYMQLPLSNVFLPHIIKNDKTLRWIQIISGSIATIVQGATLFVGEPAPYYVLFSAIEMGATAYITFDAIKWKTKNRNAKKPIEF